MTEAERLSNENYLESIRLHAGFQNPCDLQDRDGILLVAGASSFPGSYWNAAARNELSIKPKDIDEAARAFFAPKQRMFTFSVIGKQDGDLENYLRGNGYEERFAIPCMSVTRPLASSAAPEGIHIVPMTTLRHIDDFIEISAAAYSVFLPEKHVRAMFSKPEALLAENIVGAVAYRGEEAVAAGFALMSGEGAGLYWIGTHPKAERMGLGAIMTVQTTNMAFRRGAKVVTLQASRMGEPVYRRLGFETYDTLTRFGPNAL
jgi:ribosomal protein S18 acetylase RimI-like enzyme